VQDFEALTAAHKDAVYRQLIRTCGNEADAEDALIEALLRAYQSLDRLREHSAFRAWLAQIGRRVCWHLKRRDALAPIVQLSALEDRGTNAIDTSPSPEALLTRHQLQQLLKEAIAQLAPEYRDVYVLRELQGHSGPEVADRLHITLAAQKSRLHRARTQVRSFLDRRLSSEAPPTRA
jgi:RNA polymerase sigma-70 factor (ECF subfamily)